MEKIEKIDNLTDWFLFWIGCSGQKINWGKVEKRFGKQTSERLQKEIMFVLKE